MRPRTCIIRSVSLNAELAVWAEQQAIQEGRSTSKYVNTLLARLRSEAQAQAQTAQAKAQADAPAQALPRTPPLPAQPTAAAAVAAAAVAAAAHPEASIQEAETRS